MDSVYPLYVPLIFFSTELIFHHRFWWKVNWVNNLWFNLSTFRIRETEINMIVPCCVMQITFGIHWLTWYLMPRHLFHQLYNYNGLPFCGPFIAYIRVLRCSHSRVRNEEPLFSWNSRRVGNWDTTLRKTCHMETASIFVLMLEGVI